jgi:hypothetical protein
MTADESGLPELDPEDIFLPDMSKSNALLGWMFTTITKDVDLSDESRERLDQLIKDMRFQDITEPLAEEIIDDLQARLCQDPDFKPPTEEEVEEFKRLLTEQNQDEPPTEGDQPS